MSGEERAAWAGSWHRPRPWSNNFYRRGLQATSRQLAQSSQTPSRQRREPVRAGPTLPVAPPALSLQTEHRTTGDGRSVTGTPSGALLSHRKHGPQGTSEEAESLRGRVSLHRTSPERESGRNTSQRGRGPPSRPTGAWAPGSRRPFTSQ